MKVAAEKSEQFSGLESRFASWVGKSKERSWLHTVPIPPCPHNTPLAFLNKKDLSVEDMARILDDYERLRKVEGDQKPPPQKQ